jgi:hypothetical protein
MTSTRNKNTSGNYHLEQKAYISRYQNIMDTTKQTAYTKTLPGNGLLIGKMPSRDLANNYIDIESQLFGVGSTNLVQPLPYIPPDIHNLPSLNIIDKTPLIIPQKLIIEPKQRVNYLN